MPPVSETILERRMYGIAEAAALLGLRTHCTKAWLDGDCRASAARVPVIRAEHTGSEIVTWGEFVGLAFLRERRRKGVPLARLRPVIDELRQALGTPHPLATAWPYRLENELLIKAQERSVLPPPIAIVRRSGDQLILAEDVSRFLRKVEFESDTGPALRFYPAGRASPVVIDPQVRFGRPSVSGVSTDRLWELFDAGESVGEIAMGYELGQVEVSAAIAYEEQLRSLAA